jgi:hypothetical protein
MPNIRYDLPDPQRNLPWPGEATDQTIRIVWIPRSKNEEFIFLLAEKNRKMKKLIGNFGR